MSTREKRLIALLQAKRRADPQGFREYLPRRQRASAGAARQPPQHAIPVRTDRARACLPSGRVGGRARQAGGENGHGPRRL